jgi:hypothetical protein
MPGGGAIVVFQGLFRLIENRCRVPVGPLGVFLATQHHHQAIGVLGVVCLAAISRMVRQDFRRAVVQTGLDFLKCGF